MSKILYTLRIFLILEMILFIVLFIEDVFDFIND